MNIRAAEIVGGTLNLFAETLTDHDITRIADKTGRTQDSSHPRSATITHECTLRALTGMPLGATAIRFMYAHETRSAALLKSKPRHVIECPNDY